VTAGAIVVKVGREPERVLREAFFIGQAASCAVTVDDPLVSTVHAVVTRDQDGWLIQDVGSVGGTRLNGMRLFARCRLERGDAAVMGSTTVIFVPTP
jgi:pSer/pThr/pTyr-binding forkhead associated (FHA) protein